MEQFLADLINDDPHGHSAAVVHAHVEASGEGSCTDDPPWLYRAPVWKKLLFTPLSWRFPLVLSRALRECRPDVLVLHVPNVSALWALILPAARRLPCLVFWHSDIVVSDRQPRLALAYLLFRPFERWLLGHADRIVVTSQVYLESSEALAPYRDKCSVVPLGLRLERLPAPEHLPLAGAEAAWPGPGLRLLSIGRLTYYKGYAALLPELAGLPQVQWLIIGEGEDRPALQELIRQHGLEDRVRLLGGLDDDARNALLVSCNVFCLPSIERTEAFGVVLLEAMRYGRPLLIGDIPGSGVGWVGGDAAIRVPLGQPAAWQNALRALQNPDLCGQLGGRARTRFAAHFAIGQVTRRMQAVCSGLFARPCTPPNPRVLIVIPARNEAATIGEVLVSLRQQGWTHVLVINDGSSDATASEAERAGARVLSPLLPLGAWGATQAGIRHALAHDWDLVVTMDADGQHNAEDVQTLVDAAVQGHNAVIGAFPQRGSPARRLAWALFRRLTGFEFADLTSGFRAYDRNAMEILAGDEATLLDYQDVGVLLLLRRARLTIGEVSVTMKARQIGQSRVFSSWRTVLFYMLETILLCLARWQVRPPAVKPPPPLSPLD